MLKLRLKFTGSRRRRNFDSTQTKLLYKYNSNVRQTCRWLTISVLVAVDQTRERQDYWLAAVLMVATDSEDGASTRCPTGCTHTGPSLPLGFCVFVTTAGIGRSYMHCDSTWPPCGCIFQAKDEKTRVRSPSYGIVVELMVELDSCVLLHFSQCNFVPTCMSHVQQLRKYGEKRE
jgi:hypothetical protein